MKSLKRILAVYIVFSTILANLFFVSADSINIEEKNSVTVSGGGAFITATSDKYIFAATGESAKLSYEVSVYDKETLEFLTTIKAASPATIYLNINEMYVKGDYLYVAYTQRSGNGNPLSAKYNIKEIYEGQNISPVKTVGMRPKGYSFMNDDVSCRTDSGYGNITFMKLEELEDMAAIGISAENSAQLKAYTKIYIENGLLYAIYGKDVYVYDASYALNAISKQDTNVYKGKFRPGITSVTNVVGCGNYAYCSTSEGIYVYDMTIPSAPVKKGIISGTLSAKTMEINNGYLYMSNSSEIKIFSLADMSKPELVYSTKTAKTVNAMNLRPGKIYAGTSAGVTVYNVSGIEISETTVLGSASQVGEITYSEKIEEIKDAKDITSNEKYLFVLNKDKTEISVYKKDTNELVNKISKENLSITEMYCDNDYIYVSYDSVFRKYDLAKIEETNEEQMVVPLYSDMARDVANRIAQSDKYIFVAAGDRANRELLANGKILVYDKANREYITSIHVDSGNSNYDLAVRDMWLFGEKLYVSYNNVKTASNYSGSLSAVIPNISRQNSPLCSYDIKEIAKNEVLTPVVLCSNSEIPNLSHPYNRGGSSYLDKDSNMLYQGVYTVSDGQCYKGYSITPNGSALALTLKNGSVDCVDFKIKNGYLFEVLQNNGGLLLTGTTTQNYNKVLVYDITNESGQSEIDLKERLVGSYQTNVYGDNAIATAASDGKNIFVATTSGLEIVDMKTFEKKSSLLWGVSVYSAEIRDNMLFVSSQKGVHIYSLDDGINLLSEEILNTPVYSFDVNEEEKNVYITYKRNEGYGAVLSYGEEAKGKVLENLPVLKTIDKTSAALQTTSWSANSGQMILENEKYIFSVLSKHTFTSCGVVQIFDKKDGKLLANLSESTANINRYRQVRNMHLYDDVLYVVWGNAYELGDANAYVNGQVMSPVKAYDVRNVTEGLAPEGITVFTGGQRAEAHAPYILGNISYLDEENKQIYFSEVQRKTYASRYYYVYDLEALNEAVRAKNLSSVKRRSFSTPSQSMNAVDFMIKDGYLYEVLQNKAGMSNYSCDDTLIDSKGNVLNNAVKIFDLNSILNKETTDMLSASEFYRGMYVTETSGATAIKDIALYNNYLYVATKTGVEVVDISQIKDEGVTSQAAISLNALEVIKGDGGATDLELSGNKLYVAFEGKYSYSSNHSSDEYGEVILYDLKANPIELKVKEKQKVRFGVCSISVNEDEKAIYMMQDILGPPSMTAYKFSGLSNMFDRDESAVKLDGVKSLMLENIKSFKTAKSDNYILIESGENAESINKIYVYDASTKLKICEISKTANDALNMLIDGGYFYSYNGNVLNCYKIPSSACDISACLKGSYEKEGEINDISIKNGKIYVATTKGLKLLNVSSITAGGNAEYKTVYSDENIKVVSESGNYIYGATEAGKLFIYDTNSYSLDAESEDNAEINVSELSVSGNDVFCLLENGEVHRYVTNEGVVIEYNVNISEPKAKTLINTNEVKGFPSIAFRQRIYSSHNKVVANDEYVITAGAGGVTFYTKNLEEIKNISFSSVSAIYLYDNKLVVNASSSLIVYDVDDDFNELFTINGANITYADASGIWAYDKTNEEITNYSYSGEKIKTLTNCAGDKSKIYHFDGYIYTVYDKTFKMYSVETAENGADFSQLFKAQGTTVQKITEIEAVDDYLCVSTFGGSAASNRLYIYSLMQAKNGETQTISDYTYYSTSTSEQGGGKISAFTRCGDFLIADAVDDSAVQVINIKNKNMPYLESMVKKGKEEPYSYSSVAATKDKVYAISESNGLCVYDYKSIDISNITFVSGGKETLTPMGETTSAKVSIYNESGEKIDALLYMAVYDKGRLKDVTVADVEIENGTEQILQTSEFSNCNDMMIKAMLLQKGLYNPLCEYTLNLDALKTENVTIYVDKTFEGESDGSVNAPFKTINEAKEAVKKINKQMASDITVLIKGGRYEITEPITFDETDSGFNGYKVIYKAAEGETPVISGGKFIENWSLYDAEKGIWSAKANGINTRQLYVNGKRAVRARSTGGLNKASTDGGKLGIYCYNEEIADYKNIKDLELVFIGSFLSKRIGVDNAYKLDSNGKTLITMNQPFWGYPNSFNNYILPVYYENAFELLDEENEFYLDTAEDVIYYKPEADVDINTSLVCAPVLEEVLKIEGSGLYQRAQNIEFDGITISDTTWMGPTIDGGFYPTQAGHKILPTYNSTTLNSNMTKDAISIKNADSISFKNGVINNIGGNAMNVMYSQNISICGNKIYDVSAGGVYVGDIEKGSANPDDARKNIKNIYIENNYMTNIACEYFTSCAVVLGTVQNASISHNDISNTPYTAVHLGWGWDSNPKRNNVEIKVENNHIYDVMKLLGDGGAIYTTGYTLADSETNPNMIANNYIETVEGNSVFSGAAIYLDTGSSGYKIYKNVIDLTKSESAWVPKWSSGSDVNIFDSNYSTTANGVSHATNTTVSETANWNDEAKAIIENSGLTDEYKYLKK